MAKKKKRESIAPARRKPVGEVPGTIAADPTAVETRMRVIAYGLYGSDERYTTVFSPPEPSAQPL